VTSILFGTASRDRYLESGRTLPGGGVLNMAYHWAAAGKEFLLQTRIGSNDQDLFVEFLERNGIPYLPASLIAPGESSSIDIRIGADRQPQMDNYIEGVWEVVHSTPEELASLATATHWHTVLVEGAIAELERLSSSGQLDGENQLETFYPTVAVPVAGSTIGCGDAFIASFLMAHQAGASLGESVAAGQAAGAAATAWSLPLPDEAYEG
jgi:sugar/nucleoside kinase (ribokinase family)